jgi:hypothetical protein
MQLKTRFLTNTKMRLKKGTSPKTSALICIFLLAVFTGLHSFGQQKKTLAADQKTGSRKSRQNFDPESPFLSRVQQTPAYFIKKFRDAGMSPTTHQLSTEEMKIVAAAFEALPALHRKVLKRHLKSFSFLDHMPNTALAGPEVEGSENKLYHIAFRSGILKQTVSEWVTEKENTYYSKGDSSITVSVQAGLLSAFTYVLLHEGTHIVDGSLDLLSKEPGQGQNTFTKNFSRGLWKDRLAHQLLSSDSVVFTNHFRGGGRKFLLTEAVNVYKSLSHTPLVSLYSSSSWHEDLAELTSVYHLTHTLKQPFSIIVRKNGEELYRYEPMQSALVQQRFYLLDMFYKQ